MTTTAEQLREAAVEFERLNSPDRIPALDQVIRWIDSNPITAVDLVLDHVLVGHRVPAELASISDGRLRELWKEAGGSIDKHGRAFIEMDLLPRLLRFIIEADRKIARP